MRASRLLTLQMLLQTRGRMSARALADALEVSVRTLYRDIDQLAAAGVPVYAERGRAGGFRLMEGWTTRLNGLTATEAQMVFMTGLSDPATQLGLGQEVADAQLKLLSALPAGQRAEARRWQARFHLDALEWYRDAEPAPFLAEVAAAVWEDRQLHVDYESWRGRVQRRLHPLGLVLKAGVWYLVAACRSTPRTYRISSLRDVRRIDARSEWPRDFELAAYWKDAMLRFEQELYRGRATVLATPEGVRGLTRLSAVVARTVAGMEAKAGDGHGVLRIAIPIESIAHAASQLLPLAPDVVVVDPPELLAAITARLRQIGRSYVTAVRKGQGAKGVRKS